MADPPSTLPLSLPPLETPERFPFPYPQPYSIQVDLMRTVFRAIEDGKIAIVESPTGTGKSLSLLTSTLTWLQENGYRLHRHSLKELERKLAEENKDDPPWVVQHALKAHTRELEQKEYERRDRLEKARERERQQRSSRRNEDSGRPSKRARIDDDEDDMSKFLPVDRDEQRTAEPGLNLSDEVLALMRKAEGKVPEEEVEEQCTKIFYTSRTHTQLKQLATELRKTQFVVARNRKLTKLDVTLDGGEEAPAAESIRLVPLAGRKQLCINDKVLEIGRQKGDDRMNEACLDLQKSDAKHRCAFLPPQDQPWKMNDLRDQIHAEPRDIEELADLGKMAGVCPYYAARKATAQAELVTLPYNLLLQNTARESLGLSVKDQVVVIDEAHNLIDTILSIHSVNLSLRHLQVAMAQLSTYQRKFRTRLKPKHALYVAQAISVLAGLIRACEDMTQNNKSGDRVLKVGTLLSSLADGQDQINVLDLVSYLKESQLARKVSGYAEKMAEDAGGGGSADTGRSAIAAFRSVEAFLLSLADASDQGRVIVSVKPSQSGGRAAAPEVALRYMLLNPAERFQQVIDDARCIVLAGGTMEPLSDFLLQLFPFVPKQRLSTISCKHIIPSSNLLTQVVKTGPAGKPMTFTYESRGDKALLLDLGALVSSVLNLIPDGVVLFVPSYAFLANVQDVWRSTGVMAKLEQRKKIFFEPQAASQVDEVLAGYGDAVANPQGKQTGALLFAVVGAKLSEGINFSDALGRGVIMVGLPFASSHSVELKERMAYVSSIPNAVPNAGRELYENLCMRAVNQSIGRAIRHANDYATILLVDQRYATDRISQKLPQWIGKDLRVGGFPEAVRAVAGFFREKKQLKVMN